MRFRNILINQHFYYVLSNKLKSIVRLIQVITDLKIEEIASSIDYSREHLSKEMAKERPNPSIQSAILKKYKNDLNHFFDENVSLLQEENVPYNSTQKIVDVDDQLVNNSIVIKGMLRVVLRNQAFIISSQTGEDLEVVSERITAALKDELKEDFSDES